MANQLPSVVSIFTLPILSQYITKSDYGIWGMILAYLGGFTIIKDFGLITVFNNSYFKYQKNNRYTFIWKRLYGFLLSWAFLYAFLGGTVIYWVADKHVDKHLFLIVLAVVLPNAFFDSTKSLSSRLLQYNHKIYQILFVSAITTSLAVCSNIYTIKYLHWGYRGWALTYFITNFTSFLFYGKYLWVDFRIVPSLNFNATWIIKKLKVSIPSIPIHYTTFILNTSDRLILDFYKVPIAVLGGYNVAYNLGMMIDAGMYALSQVLSPIYYRLFNEKTEKTPYAIRLITFFWQAFAIIVAFLLALWVKEIYSFIYRNNPSLQELYPYAIPIYVSYSYRPMYAVIVYRTLYEYKANLNSRVSFLAAAVNLGFNFVLIPFFSIKAAIATTFVSLMVLCFTGYFWKRMSQYLVVNYYPGIWLLVIIISGIVAFVLKDVHFLYKIALSLPLVAGYLWALKGKYNEMESSLKKL